MQRRFFHSFVVLILLASASISYASKPFIPNKGQWKEDFQYKATFGNNTVFVKKDRLVFSMLEEHHLGHGAHKEKNIVKGHAFEMVFLGSTTQSFKEDYASKDYNNYFLGKDPNHWISEVRSFEQITLKSLYEGVDLLLKYTEDGLKYEFHLEKPGDVKKIRIRYNGQDKLSLNRNKLQIQTSIGPVYDREPYTYQNYNGEENPIDCSLQLDGNNLKFELKNYNEFRPVVIDPFLVFSTYTGSSADNWGFSATHGPNGEAYGAGIVFGQNYPLSFGAFQTNYTGLFDVGITKFSSDGNNLLFSTFLGGTSADLPTSLIADSVGNLYVLGATTSSNFPTHSQAYDRSLSFSQSGPTVFETTDLSRKTDLFISKIAANGTSLLASTYLGGTNNEGAVNDNSTGSLINNYGDETRGEIILDATENVYISSSSNSTSIAGFSNTSYGTYDAIAAKFNNDLSNLEWGFFIGGSSLETGNSICLDQNNNAFITGGSKSFNLINSVPGSSFSGGGADGFLTKIANISGTAQIAQSRYLGASQLDISYQTASDTEGKIYVFGQTNGSFPISNDGVYSNATGGQFFQKYDADLSLPYEWSTVMGSSADRPNIVPTAFMVNDCGNIFFSGWGGRTGTGRSINTGEFMNSLSTYGFNRLNGNTFGMPTPNGLNTSTDGSDFYFGVFNKNARDLLFGTFYGGNIGYNVLTGHEHVDGGTSRFDEEGIIYQAVCASCGGGVALFPASAAEGTPYASREFSDNCNMALVKFDLSTLIAEFDLNGEPDTTVGCEPFNVNFTNLSRGANRYEWSLGDGNFSNAVNPSRFYTEPDTFFIRLVAFEEVTCKQSDTAFGTVIIHPQPEPDISNDTIVCPDEQVLLTASGAPFIRWSSDDPRFISVEEDSLLVTATGTRTYRANFRNEFGCETDREVLVGTVDSLSANFEVDPAEEYVSFNATITNRSSYIEGIYNWFLQNPDNSISFLGDSPFPNEIHVDSAGIYNVILNYYTEDSSCFISDTVAFEAFPFLVPNIISPNGDGLNDTFKLEAELSNFRLKVYNRWGKEVYSSENYKNEWAGENEPSGMYFYELIEPFRGEEYKGWVKLMK